MQNSRWEGAVKRYLLQYIKEDLADKVILITGPRQVGKTTLAEMVGEGYQYLNYDRSEHRETLYKKAWDRSASYLIFDEIHKMKNWKRWLKGIYDTDRLTPPIIVTGSAKFDTYKKVGDSLAGRYFQFRLYPLDIAEAVSLLELNANEAFNRLMEVGGFPEPFLKNTQRFYNRWQSSHLDIILRQDLIDLETVSDIKAIEVLIDLLSKQVGSTISYSSLARTLEVSDKTIKRWLTLLENIYVIFRVNSFSQKISRSILKAPKFYFYDNARVKGDNGAKLENLTAISLRKHVIYQKDCYGNSLGLHYLRRIGGQKIDFLISKDQTPQTMVECKWKDAVPSKNFEVFSAELGKCEKIQLLGQLDQDATYPNGIQVRQAAKWLSKNTAYF